MATNLDVIRDALGLLGVLAETETASAEQGEHGLRILNDVMEDWLSAGIDVGQWPQVDINDEYPGPSGVVATVKATLAIHLAPYYEREVRPAVIAMASSGYNRLLRDSVLQKMQEADLSNIPLGQGYAGGFDITGNG